MFERKLPRCVSVAAVTTIATPSIMGTIIKLALNSKQIIKTAKEVKGAFDNAKTMAVELANQQTTTEVVNAEESVSKEVN